MTDISLSFEEISKLYSLRQVGTGTLSRDLFRWWATSVMHHEDPYLKIGETNRRDIKSNTDIVKALDDITFSVNQGEVVGIIGKNGSGKSTLLKIISKITSPTTGIIKIKGRVASLLEVGTGFHPDLTGRDNIYMNGAILGMTKTEINSKFDEIVDFSGVERYIDTPVKRYSSGMKVRLGFAVAAFLKPEILLIDEVLAVGDAEFQKRAIGKMQNISSEGGRTVLFVSHNMNSILQVCTRGIVLEDGKLIFDGQPRNAVNYYLGKKKKQMFFEGVDGDPDYAVITKAKVYDGNINNGVILSSDSIIIELEIEVMQEMKDFVVGMNLFNQNMHPLLRLDYNNGEGNFDLSPGLYTLFFEIPPNSLAAGSYNISFDVCHIGNRRFSSQLSTLNFDVYKLVNNETKRYCDSRQLVNSIIMPQWFKGIKKLR